MRRGEVANNSPTVLRTTGRLSRRIAKTLIWRWRGKSAEGLEIGAIKKSIIEFAKQAKGGKNWMAKQYREMRNKLPKCRKLEVAA